MLPPLPAGFCEEMRSNLGQEESARLFEAMQKEPSVSIRINRRKVADPEAFMARFNDFSPRAVPWCESGFYLEGRPDFIHDPLLHAGTYYVQEAGSMVYETILNNLINSLELDSEPDNRPLAVLDLCAAPGGKTTAMLNALSGNYLLVANEIDRKRVRILKENIDKWGDPNVIVTNSPPVKFESLGEIFDIVAVDAPCSGEGMMRREPVARSQWGPGLVDQCSSLQREILKSAVGTLRPGGIIIYSTCTFNKKENEENVDWLVREFHLELLDTPRRFMPHRDRCEGLFVAVLRKSASGSSTGRELSLPLLRKAGINVVGEGTEKTVDKGNLKIPSSRAVLAYNHDRNTFPEVELTYDEALSYLRRNSLVLAPGTPKGYVAVTFGGYPLGLVKNLGTRANNLYPAEWRVRT